MAIYTQNCEQKWLKTNNRGKREEGGGVEIKMSCVEKNQKINNWGGGWDDFCFQYF